MAHDDEELDWGEDDGWASEPVVATMDVDRPDLIHAGGDGGASQQTLDDDDSPHVPEKVGVSQEPKADVSPTHPATRNGGYERRDSRRTPSRSSSDFGKALPSSLPQRPTTIAPHVEESDPLAASAMARSPSKSTNGLPPDWEERKSRSNGQTYFFNLKTEETTWTKPTVPTAVSSTTPAPTRPDSPSTLRREKERKGPTSPSVPSTLPPPPFSLPARPQTFNASQPRRDRSASPPPRARSRERQKEPGRDSRGGRGDRRPAGQPPPRARDVQMRDPSPEPPRRYRSPSPQAARDRGKAGANRVYNERDRSPPPAARGQRPSSPPPRRDDRGPRRPEDRYPPRTRSRSPVPSRRRSPSPPTTRRARTPPRPRDARRPSPPPSSTLPQKRRGDTPPPLSTRSTVYSDVYDGQEDTQVKRRRVEDGNVYDGQNDRRDDRFGPRIVEDGRRSADDPIPTKRAPLPPQDQRFRTAVSKPPRNRSPRRRSPSPTSLPGTAVEARPPILNTSNPNGRDVPRNERPQEGRGIRKREGEKIKLPETSAAVVAAYSSRRRTVSSKDEVPSPVNTEVPSPRDGPASKLPPSGPGGRIQRSYGPALRDGPPRPRSPEALIGKEPPRGPRGSHRSPNVSLRPLSPRREPFPPREHSPPPPRRERSPPRRPRSPPAAQQPYATHRPNGREVFPIDYDMGTRPYDTQMGRRDEVERIGAIHPSRVPTLIEQPPAGPAPGRDGARGRNPNQTRPGTLRVWGQPPNRRSPQNEGLGRYDDGPERNSPNDGAHYQGPRHQRERELMEQAQDDSHSGYARQSHPPSRRSTVDGTPLVEEDTRLSIPDERSRESSGYSGDNMELDEDQTWMNPSRYPRDDGQSLEHDYGQRPDPLPEARRLSIRETDDASQHNRREDVATGPRPARELGGLSGNRPVRDEPLSPPQALRARSSSPGSSSHRNIRPQSSPLSRTVSDVSVGPKDSMVSSSRSEDFGATRRTKSGRPSSYEQIGNEDRSNDDDKGRKDATTGRLRIVRRELSPTSTNGLGTSREPASTQPALISVDTAKDSADREDSSALSQGLGRKGSLLARLSAPGASSSGDRSKGKRDQPAPPPTGGSSASLQARLENGDRPAISRRETDDGGRRGKKARRGRTGPGGGRNRDAQG